MTNPARSLAMYLQAKRVKSNGSTLYTDRGSGDNGGPGDFDFWRGQADLVSMARDVIEILDAMEADGRTVTFHYTAIRDSLRGLFAPDAQWNEVQSGYDLTSEAAVDHLFSLAEVIDAFAQTQAQVLGEGERKSVKAGLDELFGLLKANDLELNERDARYIYALFTAIRSALDENDLFGSIDLKHKLTELFGAMSLIAQSLDDTEKSNRTRQKMRDAFTKVFHRAPSAAAWGFLALGAVADYKQITG